MSFSKVSIPFKERNAAPVMKSAMARLKRVSSKSVIFLHLLLIAKTSSAFNTITAVINMLEATLGLGQ